MVRYTDAFGKRRRVSDDSLVAVLRALGEPIERPDDAAACLERREHEREPAASAPPVVVAWDGVLPPEGADVPVPRRADGRVPFGLHRVADTSLVISAPFCCPSPRLGAWGVFAPVYGLRDDRELVCGDLTCLAQAVRFAADAGAGYFATLPILADYPSTADDPEVRVSPYSPLSRMWWNEAYADPAQVPELAGTLPGRQPAGPSAGLADVAAASAALRPLLSAGAAQLEREGGRRLQAMRTFVAERPEVVRYATFRAAAELAGTDLSRWPARWRAGDVEAGRDVPADAVAAHVYGQWITDEQVAAVAAQGGASGCRLLLDLPVGCKPDGYDPWAFPGSFAGSPGASGATVGAPPDSFFPSGQDWGFRPLDPDGERNAGYPVVRRCLDHLMRHAGALRIDHAMGFRRLWWIPDGAKPAEGAYVRYPAEELVALSCLQAWRHGAALVGEDLGTVEPELRRLLRSHGIAGMSVAIFDIGSHPKAPIRPPPGRAAFVDTHDTATFAGWFDGSDIDLRERLGITPPDRASAERSDRRQARRLLVDRLHLEGGQETDPVAVHRAVLVDLACSSAVVVIANIEDLWGEQDPQNVPGTTTEHDNFCRFLAHRIDELPALAEVTSALQSLEDARSRARRVRPSLKPGWWARRR